MKTFTKIQECPADVGRKPLRNFLLIFISHTHTHTYTHCDHNNLPAYWVYNQPSNGCTQFCCWHPLEYLFLLASAQPPTTKIFMGEFMKASVIQISLFLHLSISLIYITFSCRFKSQNMEAYGRFCNRWSLTLLGNVLDIHYWSDCEEKGVKTSKWPYFQISTQKPP